MEQEGGKISLYSQFSLYSIQMYLDILAREVHCDVIGDSTNYSIIHPFSQCLLSTDDIAKNHGRIGLQRKGPFYCL